MLALPSAEPKRLDRVEAEDLVLGLRDAMRAFSPSAERKRLDRVEAEDLVLGL